MGGADGVTVVGEALATRLGVPARLSQAGEKPVRFVPDPGVPAGDGVTGVGVVVAEGCEAALDLVARWHAKDPELPLLVLVPATPGPGAVTLLTAGARGVADARSDEAALRRMLEALRAGEAVVPRSVLAEVLDDLRRRPLDVASLPPRHPLRRLSPRELGVLRRLAEGATTAEVANAEGVEPATVRAHLSRALHKLRLSRDEALHLFVSAGDGGR